MGGFLAKARAEGLSNTDAMWMMIRAWIADSSEPAPPAGGTGSEQCLKPVDPPGRARRKEGVPSR